jgi:hypothetical protein
MREIEAEYLTSESFDSHDARANNRTNKHDRFLDNFPPSSSSTSVSSSTSEDENEKDEQFILDRVLGVSKTSSQALVVAKPPSPKKKTNYAHNEDESSSSEEEEETNGKVEHDPFFLDVWKSRSEQTASIESSGPLVAYEKEEIEEIEEIEEEEEWEEVDDDGSDDITEHDVDRLFHDYRAENPV